MNFTSIKQKQSDSINFYGSGKITVIMVMNLGRFMAKKDKKSRELFRAVRGSYPYTRFIRNLTLTDLFKRLDPNFIGGDPWIENQGYDIGLFNRYFGDNWFFPTYELDKIAALDKIDPELSNSPIFKREWHKWDRFKVRLTRNGFIQVKLTKKFSKLKLYDLCIQLLESERDEATQKLLESVEKLPADQRYEIKQILQQTLQWQLAYQVIELFINQLSEIKIKEMYPIKLIMPEKEGMAPIRDKYTVIFLRKLLCKQKNDFIQLSSDTIFKNEKRASVIHSLWDGLLIGGKKTETILFPDYWQKEINKMYKANLSTFQDEICLIGPERTVIYCPLSKHSVYLPLKGGKTKEGIRYSNYWKCIIRGIEHIIALRTELQMVEARTNVEMNKLSKLSQDLTTKGISKQEKKDVDTLTKRVSYLFKILVSIRNVLVIPSTYRASYAVDKFKRLSEILGLQQIEKHVQKNIEELNFSISHYNNLSIQQNGERLQKLAVGFGFGIGFLGIASLIKDALDLHDSASSASFWDVIQNIGGFILNPTLLAFFMFWIILLCLILGGVWIFRWIYENYF